MELGGVYPVSNPTLLDLLQKGTKSCGLSKGTNQDKNN